MTGWDRPATAEYYAAFCRRHSRYAEANTALAVHSKIAPGMTVLDVGAGLGGTAEAVLPLLGDSGSVMCVEPAAAMRDRGRHRLQDPRVRWAADLPEESRSFDRILSGAALWQRAPLSAAIEELAARLKPGSALCFNVPALNLCEPDEPGEGSDPLFLELLARLSKGRSPSTRREANGSAPLTRQQTEDMLPSAGLAPESWEFRLRITQEAYADWLRIPVLSDGLFGDLEPRERSRLIDAALAAEDRDSWKWERWVGWTAWKK